MDTLHNILKSMHTELELRNYETDTDKNAFHSYVDHFYENEFKKYKNESISLLEIGINFGGSMYLWSKYFENGKIFGLDVTDSNVKNKYKNLQNATFLITDAYQKSISDSLPDFDIIIDDGPHYLESQISAVKLYLPKLKKGGIFIIEDVQNFDHFDILIKNTPEEFRSNIELVDLRHIKNKYDDLLFVVRN